MKALLLAFALTGCAASPLALVERPGNYSVNIKKSDYTNTVYGVYVSNETTFGDDPIKYKVLYDNTGYKKGLASRYEVDDNFKRYVASYIIHEGKVYCGSQANSAKVAQYGDDMQVLRSERTALYSEAAHVVCQVAARNLHK